MTLAAAAEAAPRPQTAALPYHLAPHALALTLFALCAVSPSVLNDGDTWSHIATGDWILAHRAVPHADPFSYSFAGKPWTAHEWLAEVALALAYRAGGFVGVSLMTGLAAAAALFVVVRRVARDLGGPALAAVGALALMLIAPSLLARPHILALPVFALFAQALFEARARDRAPPLSAALLMTLWANLHGGFAFGLALIAPLALEAVLAAPSRLAAARAWGLFALACLAAAAATPFGIEGLLFPVRLLGLHALANIGEWAPESFAHPNALEASLLGLIALAATRPFRLPPLRLALLLGLLHLSLSHARHEMLLAIVAPMLLARPMAGALGTADVPPALEARAGGTPAVAAAALGLAMLAIAVVRPFFPTPLPAPYLATRAALAELPAEVKARPVLNGYGFGGYLIFEGVRPYVDGRADMFGDSFLAHYAEIARGDRDALRAALGENGAFWTIFAPDQGAAAAMDAMPGWRRVYADRYVVVHARAE
jgi:hypothetical protein